MALCKGCGLRESTGVLVELCDPCFAAWEATVTSENIDIRVLDPSIVYEKAGGIVPNDVKVVRAYYGPNSSEPVLEYSREEE